MPPVDQTKRTGAGTDDNPLTDVQIEDLASQGYREGDNVPGSGILTPFGTFRRVESPVINTGDAKTQLDAIKAQALDVQDKVNVLRDQENLNSSNTIASSSDQVVQDEQNTIDSITTQTSGFDDSEEGIRSASAKYTALLDDEIARLDKQYKEDQKIIEQQYAQAEKELKGDQKRESAFLNTTLTRIGGYLGASASGTGAMLNLAQEHRNEIAQLASAKIAALQAAKTAVSDKQFELAKAKAQEAKDVEEAIAQKRVDYLEQIAKLQEQAAKDKKAAQDEMNRLRDDARSSINTLLDSFGSLPLQLLPEEDLNLLKDMAALAGIPGDFLGAMPTREEVKQDQLQQDREFDNQISLASLGIRQAALSISQTRLSQDLQISDIEAQRRGLPQSVIGMSEARINADIASPDAPDWFTNANIDKSWTDFQNDVIEDAAQPFFGYTGNGTGGAGTALVDPTE